MVEWVIFQETEVQSNSEIKIREDPYFCLMLWVFIVCFSGFQTLESEYINNNNKSRNIYLAFSLYVSSYDNSRQIFI